MKIKLVATAAAVLLTVGACATTESSGTTTEERQGTNAQPSDEAAEEPTEEEPADDGTATFGETYEWSDGLAVKITKPKPFQPSEYAAVGKGKPIEFTVTIVNNTGAPFDAAGFYATMQSGNTEASEVFDSAQGFEGSPMTKVLDGREAKFKIGYTVSRPDDLVLEVTPSFEHESVLYTS